jgi:hypothetical protein
VAKMGGVSEDVGCHFIRAADGSAIAAGQFF